MKTVLVIDDHPIVLAGIQSVLLDRKYKVEKASTAAEALKICNSDKNIDLIVCDLSLQEGTDGLDLIRSMRESGFIRPTIVYTMHEELWNIATLMKADVEGIVLKGDDISELVFAIDRVASGRTYRSAAFDERRTEALNTDGILSAVDIEVLRRLSKGEHNRDISAAMCLSEKSIEYHRSNILRKLCSRTMAEATRRAIRLGIITVLCMAVSVTTGAETPEAVDLGLSVLWADRNLGAGAQGEAGEYIAFAETEEKTAYTWASYLHCDNGDMFQCHDLGSDNISGTVYDAAAVRLGGGWRMPTVAEFEELCACEYSSATEGEMPVIVFVGANGNSINLPVAGYMSNERLLRKGAEGIYWTGNCEIEEEEYEGELMRLISPFNLLLTRESVISPTYGNASLGACVRPVKDRSTALGGATSSPASVRAVYSVDGLKLSDSGAKGFYIEILDDGTVRKVRK
ncbi:MAG: response regulator transcription factor [Muribaculaceae bacterium]|nr:response regulator transcription factor [Muribaculaceae bacterium]